MLILLYWALFYSVKKVFLDFRKIQREKTVWVFFSIITLKTFKKIIQKLLHWSPFFGKVAGCRSTALPIEGSPVTLLKSVFFYRCFFANFWKNLRFLNLWDTHWQLPWILKYIRKCKSKKQWCLAESTAQYNIFH